MISNQYKYWSRQGSFASTVGRQTLLLEVGNPLMVTLVRLTGTITNSGVAPVGPVFQHQLAFLKRLEMIVNGRDTVISISPQMYAARRQYETGGIPMRGMETAFSLAANGVTNFDITIPLHHDLVRGRKMNDAALDLRGIQFCQLAATFGSLAATDVFTTPNGAVISNVTLSVECQYMANVPATQQSGRNKGKPYVYAVRQLDEINVPLIGTNNNFVFDVDQRTGFLIRSLMLVTLTANVGDDAPLINGSIRLKSGETYFENSQTPIFKAAVRDSFRLHPADEIVGVDYLDVLYDGKLSTGIPTGKLTANLQLQLDATLGAGPTAFTVQRECTRPLQVS